MLSKEELTHKIREISHEKIQKPRSDCQLLGMSKKNGTEALVYELPSTTKKVTMTEFYEAYKELNESSFINHTWYTHAFPKCDSTSPCNFTTIGGVLTRLGFAEYNGRGYIKQNGVIL